MALSNFTQAISFGQSQYQLRNENVQNLRISTWNISGAKHNTYFLRKLLNCCDLCCLQEHWLFPDNLEPFLNSVDINFKSWSRGVVTYPTHRLAVEERAELLFFGDTILTRISPF